MDSAHSPPQTDHGMRNWIPKYCLAHSPSELEGDGSDGCGGDDERCSNGCGADGGASRAGEREAARFRNAFEDVAVASSPAHQSTQHGSHEIVSMREQPVPWRGRLFCARTRCHIVLGSVLRLRINCSLSLGGSDDVGRLHHVELPIGSPLGRRHSDEVVALRRRNLDVIRTTDRRQRARWTTSIVSRSAARDGCRADAARWLRG